MFSFLDPLLLPVHDLLVSLAPVIPPALSVVLLTLLVRLALHPSNRKTMKGNIARRELAPRLAELREQHKDDPKAHAEAMMAAHQEAGVPVAPGCLSMLVQIPLFSAIYRLFTADELAGHHNALLDQTALGVPLGGHLMTVDPQHRWIFFALIALTVLVSAYAAWQMRRHMAEDRAANAVLAARSSTGEAREVSDLERTMQESMEQVMKILPLMSFFTVIAVVSLPLAAGLYLVTSSTWGVLERASLRRMRVRANAAGSLDG